MKCFYHPDREAVNTCSKCGHPICRICTYITGTHPICLSCDNIAKKNAYPLVIPKIKAKRNTHQLPFREAKAGTYSNHGLIAVGILLLVIGTVIGVLTFKDRISPSSPQIISPLPETVQIPEKPVKTSENLQEIETILQDKSSLNPIPYSLNEYTDIQPPIKNAKGERIYLVNNPNAKDPSFDSLKSFILSDRTDESEYQEKVRNCVDFAETLHNNAEQNGIRAAFAAILYERPPHHAINAFKTTDKGMVYIDCTGIKMEVTSPCQIDRIAYVEIRSRYGIMRWSPKFGQVVKRGFCS